MITIEDTQKFVKVVIAEITPIFATKEEFKRLENKADNFGLTADKVLAELLDFRQEMSSLIHNQTTIKQWMRPVSAKTGMEYPF
jgi:hypothetical protein